MCGIVGVISSEGNSHSTARRGWLKQALMVDTLRGPHSTGIAAIPINRDKHEEKIYKKAVQGFDFVDMKEPAAIIRDVDHYKFIIGHNRFATKGEVNNQNAHPFAHGDTIMVHNGSLDFHHNFLEFKDPRFSVDSEAICYAIDKYGAEEVIPQLHGAFALVWYDRVQDTLNMVRNTERPLFFGVAKDNDTVVYASEEEMILWLCDRNNMKLDKMYRVKEGRIITFGNNKNLSDFDTKEVKLYTPPPAVYRYNYGTNGYDKSYGGGKGKAKSGRYTNVEERLNKLGFKKGDTVRLQTCSFERYNNHSNQGIMEGYIIESPFLDTISFAVDISVYDPGAEFTAEVFSLKTEKIDGKFMDTLVVGNLVLNEDEALYSGPGNVYVPLKRYKELTKDGCGVCTGDITTADHRKLEWQGDSPICPMCQDTDEHALMVVN